MSANMLLPYLSGVSPDALIRARLDAPDSFRLLRNELLHISAEVPNGTGEEVAVWLHDRARDSLEPKIVEARAQMTSIAKKLTGRYQCAATVGLGGMIAAAQSTSVLVAVAGIVSAVGVVIQGHTEGAAKRSELAVTPLYFLWRAGAHL